jgi:hypothetical protein
LRKMFSFSQKAKKSSCNAKWIELNHFTTDVELVQLERTTAT